MKLIASLFSRFKKKPSEDIEVTEWNPKVPTEILIDVFRFLDQQSNTSVQQTCCRWNSAVSSNKLHIPFPIYFSFTYPVIIDGLHPNKVSFFKRLPYRNYLRRIDLPIKEAVTNFWNHQSVILELVVYANPVAYQALLLLTDDLKNRKPEAGKVLVKKLIIVVNHKNQLDVRHPNRGLYDMVNPNKVQEVSYYFAYDLQTFDKRSHFSCHV